ELFGLRLENQSKTLVHLLELLLKHRQDTRRQKTYSSNCKDVLCVLKDPAIFGPKLGPRLLYMIGKYGINGSEHVASAASRWTDSEIDDVLTALADFPPGVLPAQENKLLVHYRRDVASNGGGTIANASIYIYGRWDRYSQPERQLILFHELAH